MFTHHVLAVLPPDNVAGDIARFQMTLFREEGLVSAQALPPILPMLWTIHDVPRTVVVPEVMRNLAPIQIGIPVRLEAAVVVPVTLSDEWAEWIGTLDRYRSRPAAEVSDLLPSCASGFFVCSCESGPVRLPPTEWKARRLTSIAVALMALTFRSADRPWESVDWQIHWKRYVKLRG